MLAALLRKHTFTHAGNCYGRPGRHPGDIAYVSAGSVLMHVVKGRGDVVRGGARHPVKPGDVIYCPPFTRYAQRFSDAEALLFNIHYTISVRSGRPLGLHLRLPATFDVKGDAVAQRLLDQLRALVDTGDDDAAVHAAPLSHRLIVHYYHSRLRDCVRVHGRFLDERFRHVYDLVDSGEYHAFDIRGMAKQCGLSMRQFERRFNLIFGASPRDFLDVRRYARICEELRFWDNSRNLDELADDYGFSNYSYFSHWFKKHAGMSPSKALKMFQQHVS